MKSFNTIILWNLYYFLGYFSYGKAEDWKTQVQELIAEHNFFWGVATSAYQIEGGWNQDGKGESMWDEYTHKYPHRMADQSNGDIACDSYNNLERDLKMVDTLNVDYYRISISWTRIMPDGGLTEKLNEKGLQYYHRLFDALIAKNITPMVTIYHWDLPKTLHTLGGWQNELIIPYFEKYARTLFKHFGQKVQMWVTINEPYHICELGYGGVSYAPEDYVPGVSNYLCMHNLLKAHARAYHLYQNEFKAQQNGIVGYVSSCIFKLPFSQDQEDIDASIRGNGDLGWAVNPIFGPKGDYSEIVKENVAMVSQLQGLKKSRLPEFTKEEIEYIKGSADFLGINYYTSRLARTNKEVVVTDPTFMDDMRVTLHVGPNWVQTSTEWLQIVPEGLKAALDYVRRHFNNPLTIITEIGCTGEKDNEVDQTQVIKYYKDHINVIHEAVTEEGINVRGFVAWSLMDSFEWDTGYTISFGLYHTNFTDPKRSTSIKKSGKFYQEINQYSKETRRKSGVKLLPPSELLIQNRQSSSSSLKSSLFIINICSFIIVKFFIL